MTVTRPRFKPCVFCGAQARRASSNDIVGSVDYICTKHSDHVETLLPE
jgi:hypothetical protein